MAYHAMPQDPRFADPTFAPEEADEELVAVAYFRLDYADAYDDADRIVRRLEELGLLVGDSKLEEPDPLFRDPTFFLRAEVPNGTTLARLEEVFGRLAHDVEAGLPAGGLR